MAGYREFQTGEVLTAANVNGFLMEQAVMTFADDAARTAALAGVLREGMLSYNLDTARLEVYDGTDWVEPAPPPPAGFAFAGTRYLETSGNFVKTDPFGDGSVGTPKAIRVGVVGGGGSGGGAGAVQGHGGGGGGGGGYAERFITDIAGLDATIAVIIGAGGDAPAAGNNDGNAGGTSSFGTNSDPWFTSAEGGVRGDRASQTGGHPSGGAGIAGDLLVNGSAGGNNQRDPQGPGGVGGSSGRHYGGGGSGGTTRLNQGGLAGGLYGGGGGGGASGGSATAGGAGAAGLVIIDVFV